MKLNPPPENDDRTRMPGTGMPASPRPALGDDNRLPIGTRLGEFEITGLIGEGGFGIVYLAYDHSLEREIALKEYMPSALAARTGGLTVSVKSARHTDTFHAGLKSFINEARLLAKFDHTSLVKVYRFWEANGTAYMVMPFYHGMTLKETLLALGGPPDEAWLKDLLRPLVDALDLLHREQCFHRDIAPDNILILGNGRPLLLDFGAARRVIGDMTQALTVILKPGYAPIEQYADMPTMKQGAWTDIYALASVVYLAIMGKPPLPSVARLMSDPLTPLSEQAAGRYSPQFLRGVDRGLQLKPEDRPQNVAEFGLLLGLGNRRERERTPQPSKAPQFQSMPATQASESIVTMVVPAAKHPKTPGMRSVWYAIPILALILGAGWILRTANQPSGITPQIPQPARHTSIANAPLPIPKAPENINRDTSVKTPDIPAPTAPFDPIQALDEIFRGRDQHHTIEVSLEKSQVRINKDRFQFTIRSSKPGYVYLLMVGTGQSHFHRLFPNAIDSNNRIAVNKPLSLPRHGWHILAQGPAGTDHLIAIVSDRPRDFRAAGLIVRDPFAEFPLDTAEKLHKAHTGSQPLFAGQAICAAGADCSTAYGAAIFSIEEVDGGASLAAPAASPKAAESTPKRQRVRPPEPSAAKQHARPAADSSYNVRKDKPDRCSDLLLRASLGEQLTSEEQAAIRKECI